MSKDQKTCAVAPMLESMALPTTEELRALWQRGVESGPGRFASIEEIKKEAPRRASEG